MPYESQAQQGLFHSPNSPVSKKVVADFDAASKGQKGLPYHVGDKPKGRSAKELFSKKGAAKPKPSGNPRQQFQEG